MVFVACRRADGENEDGGRSIVLEGFGVKVEEGDDVGDDVGFDVDGAVVILFISPSKRKCFFIF